MGRVLLLLLLTVCVGVGQSPPPLPDLALTSFPPSARDAVSRAQREAIARPMDADAVGALARVLHAWEQWESAHQTYLRAQALAPRTFDWPYLDAVVLQRLVRHSDAAARLDDALLVNPAYLPARAKLAESLLEIGEVQRSRELFEALARVPDAEPVAEIGLGRIAAAEGRHGEAIKHLERAIALFPELGAAHYALARSYRATGRPADAERALQQHARYGARWPGIDDPVLASVTRLRDDARATLQRGVAQAEAGDVEGAIASHESALRQDPSLVQAHANLIALYGRARNWAKAEEQYHIAIKSGVSSADAHYDYGVVLGLQEQWDRAADAYRLAMSVNPLHTQAHNNLGQILERSRQLEAAAAEYRRAVNAQPSFRLARFNLGRMLLFLGQPEQAVVEFEKLQQPVDAETPRYLFALSTAHVRAGRKDEGIKLASDARRLALDYGQTDLADAIVRELAKLK
jgi:tetratricopeptide (TPR) repeat protein